MLDFLRTRLAQGSQTLDFPSDHVAFPERFRGRPVIRSGAAGVAELDLGACLFSPEEAAYDHQYGLASRTRAGLVMRGGTMNPATALDDQMRRLLGRSLRLRSVSAGSCNGCEGEMVALGNVVFDLARFGVQFVASPRHADGIVITGSVNDNMRDALERTYAAVSDPRIVIAVGACAASGGPFRDSAVAGRGVPPSIPVDLWIAGCPPHPLTILDGLLRLLGRIADGERRPPEAGV
ncbi:MAG: NADH-quinone oxidoreductase subunit NuoB [Gemmatimonadota bacterium]